MKKQKTRVYTLHQLKLRNEHQTQNAKKLERLEKFREFEVTYVFLSFYGFDEECPAIRKFLNSEGTESDLSEICSILKIDRSNKY